MFSFFTKSKDITVPPHVLEELYEAAMIALGNSPLILTDMAKDIRDDFPGQRLVSKLDEEATADELERWDHFQERITFFNDLPCALSHTAGLLRKYMK